MTREEAIKNIKEHCYFANLIPQAKEALEMAIKALEHQEKLKDFFMKDCESCKAHSNAFFNFDSEIIKRNDYISRENAIKMIQQYGVGSYDFENYTPEQAERFVIQKLTELPSVGKDINAPTTDCISREILDRELYERFHEEGNTITMITLGAVRNFINELPSVKPAIVWHKVEDELPKEHICEDGYVEPSESVLVMLSNGEQKVTRFWGNRRNKNDYNDWLLSYPTTLKVIAWTPLPEWEE